MLSFRRLAIRYATPAFWGTNPRALARALRRFADVEADSGWQAMRIVQAADDPAVRASFFEIALEEASHASWFREAALRTCGDIEDRWEFRGREPIYAKGDDLALAIMELEINERIVYQEFEDYANACNSEYVKATFERVRLDEAGHGDKSHCITHSEFEKLRSHRLLKKAYIRRWQRDFSAVSRFLGDSIARLFLILIFYLLGGPSKLIGALRWRPTPPLASCAPQSGEQ